MARSTLDEQIELGLLTANSAATIMPMSRTSITTLGKRGLIPRLSTPGIREVRFSALELLRYCIDNMLPVAPKLQQAAYNYAAKYGKLEDYNRVTLHCKPLQLPPIFPVSSLPASPPCAISPAIGNP